MQINNIHQIPILDKNKKILGLYVWDEINLVEEKGNQVIVMAGGKGKRMLPYTKKCPKPLLIIGEKPILEHILLKAKMEGFNKFTFSINYLGYKIKNFFNDGNRWNVKIKYVKEFYKLKKFNKKKNNFFIFFWRHLGFMGKRRSKNLNPYKLIKYSIFSIYLYFLDKHLKNIFLKSENI